MNEINGFVEDDQVEGSFESERRSQTGGGNYGHFDEIELFVPGRVCLLGEHTDWSGGFRRFNKEIVPGATLVTGTNTGIFAKVRKHPSKLIITSTDNDGSRKSVEISMDLKSLLQVAQEGGHWSYVAGVAYKMLEENRIGGLVLNNFRTTLPLKKGLSSSAAICVLTARALNKLYDLRLTVRGEMEYAYQGELVTPSQCGRLDQACAFGSSPVLMRYDGEFTSVEKLPLAVELHFVVVDLCAEKSTVKILQDLQSAYPFATTEAHRNLHKCFGKLNQEIIESAMQVLTTSPDSPQGEEKAREALGALLNKAQENFDQFAAAVCPSQLTAPILHKCLGFPALQGLIYGGKCVGSGGDGTAQLLCKNSDAQNEVARIIKEQLGMHPMLLTMSPSSRIRTAVIPAGGFAGSLFPGSYGCKAEMFPILDPSDGLCKPLILCTVEMLLGAGIDRVILMVQSEDLGQFQRLFKEEPSIAHKARLPLGKQKSYSRRLVDMGRHVEFVVQGKQAGFGHAVYCARENVGENPFLLVLGHHMYLSGQGGRSCVEQILDAHTRLGTNIIGLKRTRVEDVTRFGTVTGSLEEDIITVTKVVEKPRVEFAQANLRIAGLDENFFATAFGMYALDSAIFDILKDHVSFDLRSGENSEIAFTPALDKLREESSLQGIIIDGERLAINNPKTFIETNYRLLQLSERQSKTS